VEKWLPFLAALVSLGVNLLLAWVGWSLRQLAKEEVARARTAMQKEIGDSASKFDARIQRVAGDVDAHDTRITRLEETIKALPQRGDFERLGQEIEQVGRLVAGQTAALDAVKASTAAGQAGVDRLYQYLLTNTRDRLGA
jgi:phage shock protein A